MDLQKLKPNQNAYFLRYAGAILSVILVLSISLVINYFLTIIISPLFLAAILFSAWWGGLRAGFLATIISGALIDYFFVVPLYSMTFSTDEIIRFFIFSTEGFLFSWLIQTVMQKTEEISNSSEQLRSLSLYQQVLREEERKRISLEIHDELGQALSGIKMEVYLLNSPNKNKSPINDKDNSAKITELLATIDSTIRTVRKIATELRPPILDDLGLVAAVEWQASEFERRTGIACKLTTNMENIELDSDRATAVFRIFQESLTNIMRHAEAASVNVNLIKQKSSINLSVSDDGKGIQDDELKGLGSLGLLGMKERARLINGEINIIGEKLKGTCVELTFPYTEEILHPQN